MDSLLEPDSVNQPVFDLVPPPVLVPVPYPVFDPLPEPEIALEPEPLIALEPEPVHALVPDQVTAPEPEPVIAIVPEPVLAPVPDLFLAIPQRQAYYLERVTVHYNERYANDQDRQLPAERRMSNYLMQICDTHDLYEFNFVFGESGPTNTVTRYPLKPHSI